MLWALFLDKIPTSKTKRAALWGLAGLLLTLVYFIYVLVTIGIV